MFAIYVNAICRYIKVIDGLLSMITKILNFNSALNMKKFFNNT